MEITGSLESTPNPNQCDFVELELVDSFAIWKRITQGLLVFGDCGAFSYHRLDEPPYRAEDTVDFYGDGEFTHGCSVDHVIFDFDILSPKEEADLDDTGPRVRENRRRFEISLQNAAEFISKSKRLGNRFVPLGVVQGWSPLSMANAARKLVSMGYQYIAIGGMVPQKTPAIVAALGAIRDEIGRDVSIHILGFAKADEIRKFEKFGLASFDTTSPLIRAFKDARNNYYLKDGAGGLTYYSAVRIPQALENNALGRFVKAGRIRQEDLIALEKSALSAMRGYAAGGSNLDEVLEDILVYTKVLLQATAKPGRTPIERSLALFADRYRRTLADRPWDKCACAVCRSIGVEAIIFRASNRNKRRGIHNLSVYYDHLNQHKKDQSNGQQLDL